LSIFAQRDIASSFNYRKFHHLSIGLFYVLIFNFYLALLLEIIWLKPFSLLYDLSTLIVSILFFKIHGKSLKGLFYSFWGLTFFFFCYAFFLLFKSVAFDQLLSTAVLYFCNIVILILICYFMSTPMYYPIFNWWEYDFRFRSDLKATFYLTNNNPQQNYREQGSDCRLSDLRRGAGCLTSFMEFQIPSSGFLSCLVDDRLIEINVALTTISDAIPGRGNSYGIKFIVNNKEDKVTLSYLMDHWREEVNRKTEERFKI